MSDKSNPYLSEAQKIDRAESLIKNALKTGADAADALIYDSLSSGTSVRLGKLENSDHSESRDLGLRVFVGDRQASVSSTDFSDAALESLVERAVAMAKLAPADPYTGLADKALLASKWPDLELADDAEPSTDALTERALAAEQAGLDVKGVENSLGAGAGWGRTGVVLATSHGFCGSYQSTYYSTSCSVLAGEGTAMERDGDGHSTRHFADLMSPEEIGKSAGERTVAKLAPRKVESQAAPVVFDPRVSATLIGHFAGAIHGGAIARGTSFLKECLNQEVFAKGVTVVDDPHRVKGLGSKSFDGEGVANQRHKLIDDGVLTTWLLNTAAAKQLELTTTGHATRGTGGPPGISTTNLYMEGGSLSPADLIADIDQGLLVTGLIGQGVNGVTGDYSRGANGFWIENGEITFPVSEVTIAGNLKEMFLRITPANDLEFRYGTNAPTLRVEGMTIAGA